MLVSVLFDDFPGFLEGFDAWREVGLVSAHDADEVADVAGFDVAAFDLDDDAFCFARIVINKNLDAVDAFVRAFLARPP